VSDAPSAGAAAIDAPALRATWRALCEVPAPTGAEGARGDAVADELRRVGLAPRRDRVGNVLVELPGGVPGAPRTALVAHLDTVFGPDVDVRVRETDAGHWAAPGIGDNAASVAALVHLAGRAVAGLAPAHPPLLLAFTVGEEGLGNLRGARALVEDEGAGIDLFLAIDGHLGSVVDAGVGSWRARMAFTAKGGHAWGDFPSPSAVHALGDAVHAVTRLPLPDAPRSTVNVGQVAGGRGVNAIAETAEATLEVRSVDDAVLDRLRAEAEKRIRSVARRHDVGAEVTELGHRPAGRSDDGRWARLATAVLRERGLEARTGASSTDANAAMAAGIPALCLGVYRGGDAHRESEWADPSSLADGLAALEALLERIADGA